MTLEFSVMDCGGRRALVITPTEHTRVHRSRLEQLRSSPFDPRPGPIDQEILDVARSCAPAVHFTIFRGCDDAGHGSWGLADDVVGDDAIELSYYLLREQMGCYRGLVRAGLLLHLHVDWPARELAAHHRAAERYMAELRAAIREGGGPKLADPALLADLWILRNLTLYFSVHFDALRDAFLPESLPLMERRIGRARQLMAAVPE